MKVYTSTSCVVTILCIFAISSTQGMCHHDKESRNAGVIGWMKASHHLQCCGNLTYITSESACCNGIITQGISHLVAYCCGFVAYNPLNEICCDGKIFTRSSAYTQCCGKYMYQTTTHICCNGSSYNKMGFQNDCCGKEPFDTTMHCCCIGNNKPEVKPKNDPCCQRGYNKRVHTEKAENQEDYSHSRISTLSELKCGSDPFNPETQICCSGVLFKKSSELTKCCGKDIYSFTDDNVLCCNGTFHREVPKQSECVGSIMYTPGNSTCQLSARPRLGEHCCGGQPFSPHNQICCNGQRHYKLHGNFCCGSEVYDYHNKRCCSGHLHNLSYLNGKAECCGNLLMEYNKNQTCCSSSFDAVMYDTKSGHRCCGHHYYNTSLWSCCAENLKPIKKPNIFSDTYRLKSPMDLIPGICNKTVLLGKVESMALDISQRHIVLQVLLQLNWNSEHVIKDPWLVTSLDHCSSPALENGMTYLWEENPENQTYKPLSHPINLTSDIHSLYTVCYNRKGNKGG